MAPWSAAIVSRGGRASPELRRRLRLARTLSQQDDPNGFEQDE